MIYAVLMLPLKHVRENEFLQHFLDTTSENLFQLLR